MVLRMTDIGGTIPVYQGDVLLTRYNADTEGSKPGFDIVALPAGVGTRSGENLIVAAPHDHPWHLRMFFCQKLVDGINCWESEINEEAGRPYGYAEHDGYKVTQTGEAVEITQEATWRSDRGEELLGDERTIRTHVPADGDYLITWEQEVTTLDETRHLSSETLHGHYSGLSTRFERSLADGRVLLPDDTDPGETSSSRAASGLSGRWCDYSGPLDGKHGAGDLWTAGIAMFDHSDNDCHPVSWFIMTEPFGFLAANPTWETVLTLAPGESQSWTWGCWIHSNTPDERRVEEAYREFIS